MSNEDELKQEIKRIHQRMTDHYKLEDEFKDEIRAKLDPMYEVFTKSRGFADITIALMKSFLLIGAFVGLMYGFIKWIKS